MTAAAATAAIIASNQRKARDRIIAHLKDATAFSSSSASPLPALTPSEQKVLAALLACGAVVAVGSGAYYLEAGALQADDNRRRRQQLVGVIIGVAMLLGLLAFVLIMRTAEGKSG